MSRDPVPPGPPDPFADQDPGQEPPRPVGRIGPTRPGPVIAFALVGLVAGWALRPLSTGMDGTAPTVGWLPVAALFFVALVTGAVAWSTYRSVQRRREVLQPHHAVNRLVLAKSCALAGALVAGGYFGYALSWVGLVAELARERMVHAAVGGVAGIALVVAALLLERACRVREGED